MTYCLHLNTFHAAVMSRRHAKYVNLSRKCDKCQQCQYSIWTHNEKYIKTSENMPTIYWFDNLLNSL